MEDVKQCPCCGQNHPYPTKPGTWEYNENPVTNNVWVRVVVKQDKEGLTMTRVGEQEPSWWPNQAAWRKVVS